jgi:hypothetical protein
MRAKLSVALILSAFLSGVSCSSSSSEKTENHSDSYNFTLNGCETKEHKFTGSSEDDVRNQICAALKNEDLNNGCAVSLRYEMFKQKCPGISWQ